MRKLALVLREVPVFLWSMLTNFWKSSKMEIWRVWLCFFSNVMRSCGTKHYCDVGRIADSAGSLLSEIGNKSRLVLIPRVSVCAALPESLDWSSKGQCRDFLTFFTEPHFNFDLLALPKGNKCGGKINMLEMKHFIFGYRELDLL